MCMAHSVRVTLHDGFTDVNTEKWPRLNLL